MAKKNLTEKPTSINDYAYSEFVQYSREEFVNMYPLGASSVVSTIGKYIAGFIPKVGWIVGISDALSGLTLNSRERLVNEVYTAFAKFPQYKAVRIAAKFKGYRKGSQGWFWVPADGYMTLYV